MAFVLFNLAYSRKLEEEILASLSSAAGYQSASDSDFTLPLQLPLLVPFIPRNSPLGDYGQVFFPAVAVNIARHREFQTIRLLPAIA